MIRISFNKIEISQNTSASHIQLKVESQTSETFKLKPKKIRNKVAKFYGDFVELENNSQTLWIMICGIQEGKAPNLLEKLIIKRNTYGYSQKKSHVLQTKNIKIWFDSERFAETVLDSEQNMQEFDDQVGIAFLSPRLARMKLHRGFSPNEKRITQQIISTEILKNSAAKNISLRIFPKSVIQDTY